MSTSLLVVIKASNGYSGSSAQTSITSQTLHFDWKCSALEAEKEIHKSYLEISGVRVYTTILEGTV
jgi:hypothetical protein